EAYGETHNVSSTVQIWRASRSQSANVIPNDLVGSHSQAPRWLTYTAIIAHVSALPGSTAYSVRLLSDDALLGEGARGVTSVRPPYGSPTIRPEGRGTLSPTPHTTRGARFSFGPNGLRLYQRSPGVNFQRFA